jgi:hypothetical protein
MNEHQLLSLLDLASQAPSAIVHVLQGQNTRSGWSSGVFRMAYEEIVMELKALDFKPYKNLEFLERLPFCGIITTEDPYGENRA